MRSPFALAPLLLLLAGCADEELLHGLDERQANEVLVALDDAGLRGSVRAAEGTGAGWTLTVGARDAASARRILSERSLPRPRAPGFGDVFGEGGMIPTPLEEHARYLHALSGELSRTLASLDGVVEARVHVGLPQEDPLRPTDRAAPRAAVLLRCQPAGCARIHGMDGEIRALVAGAADGLVPEAVSLLVAEAGVARDPEPTPRGRPGWRWGAAAGLILLAALLGLFALRARLPWPSRWTRAA